MTPATKQEIAELPVDLREAVIGILEEPFPAQVYITVSERPGATIAQVAARIGESPRRVRHQIERMVAAGIVAVDSETPRRNARERHYRTISWARIFDDFDRTRGDDSRRKVAHSVVRLIVTDLGRAVRDRTFGTHRGHAEVRVPGEVDEEGWSELAQLMEETTLEMEDVMRRAARRLGAAGEAGTEVVSALLLFEGHPWEEGGEARSGPRPSQWHETEPARMTPALHSSDSGGGTLATPGRVPAAIVADPPRRADRPPGNTAV